LGERLGEDALVVGVARAGGVPVLLAFPGAGCGADQQPLRVGRRDDDSLVVAAGWNDAVAGSGDCGAGSRLGSWPVWNGPSARSRWLACAWSPAASASWKPVPWWSA
jgi:hypothetical protein